VFAFPFPFPEGTGAAGHLPLKNDVLIVVPVVLGFTGCICGRNKLIACVVPVGDRKKGTDLFLKKAARTGGFSLPFESKSGANRKINLSP
jgi:hypothetical protein